MKTITLLNSKGGVGKSTLAVSIAAGLAMAGHKVILMDADMQGNATSALGVENQPHIYNLLVRPNETEWRDVLTPIPTERYSPIDTNGVLFVCASNAETRSIANNTGNADVLAERLAEIEDAIDYVVFDTSPQADLMHALIYGCTDYILIPTELEQDSIIGVTKSLIRANNIRRAAAQQGQQVCQILGIIPNMMRANTVLHTQTHDKMKYEYGSLVWDALPNHIVVPEARLHRTTVYNYAPTSKVAGIMHDMMARLFTTLETVTE
ncbi:MAG: ParA family protein [Chloroflexota bacterium]